MRRTQLRPSFFLAGVGDGESTFSRSLEELLGGTAPRVKKTGKDGVACGRVSVRRPRAI